MQIDVTFWNGVRVYYPESVLLSFGSTFINNQIKNGSLDLSEMPHSIFMIILNLIETQNFESLKTFNNWLKYLNSAHYKIDDKRIDYLSRWMSNLKM